MIILAHECLYSHVSQNDVSDNYETRVTVIPEGYNGAGVPVINGRICDAGGIFSSPMGAISVGLDNRSFALTAPARLGQIASQSVSH